MLYLGRVRSLARYSNRPSWAQNILGKKGADMFSTLCTKLWILKDNLKEDARGVSALEYAILIAIVIGAVVVFFSIGEGDGPLDKIFGGAKDALETAADAIPEKDSTP